MFNSSHLEEFFQLLERSLLVIFFGSSQSHHHVNIVSFLKELVHLLGLYQKIVLGGPDTDLNLFQPSGFLRQTSFLIRLPLHISILIKAHQAGYRRLGVRGYLNKVQALPRLYQRQRFFSGHDAEVFGIGSDHPDFGRNYFVVDSWFYGFVETFFLFEYPIMVVFVAKIVNFRLAEN